MSELIENSLRKKELLKHLMLQLHSGTAPQAVRNQLSRLMGEVPYERVVEDDLKRAVIVAAGLVFHLANRDELLPRFGKDEMPAPPPARK